MESTTNASLKKEQSERLELIRKDSGLTQSDFAKYLEIEPGSYSDIKRGKNGISRNLLAKLEKKLHVNTAWLLNNEGAMYRLDDMENKPEANTLTIPPPKMSVEHTNAYIEKLFALINKKDEQIEKKDEQIKDLMETIKNLLMLK